MTCSGPVPTHALALPNTVRAEASLYNTAKRGYDKAKTHSNERPMAMSGAGWEPGAGFP